MDAADAADATDATDATDALRKKRKGGGGKEEGSGAKHSLDRHSKLVTLKNL